MENTERSVKLENPNFLCKYCQSDDLWYTTSETLDGAYDKYHYHCHACTKKWTVVDECD